MNHEIAPVNLFWFRRDLRLHDNAGLYHALNAGLPVVPLFIFDKNILDDLEDSMDARLSFIYATLQEMKDKLNGKGIAFDIRYGDPMSVFKQLCTEYAIQTVFTNHDYEPYAIERDKAIGQFLKQKGIAFRTFKDQVIFEKAEVVKQDASPYLVFTPFSKKWTALFDEQSTDPFDIKKKFNKFYQQKQNPVPALVKMGFEKNEAIPKLSRLNEAVIQHYHQTRDTPSIEGTSRLGIHLRFGTISIREVVAKARSLNKVFLGELIWREFFMQLLWHFPHVVNQSFKPAYSRIRWRNNEKEFERWCEGQTGYPIVDAGMRELNATGFMHNRVRMITASFLVKHLLVDWRWGEAYFAKKLLDYELSSNNGNWQWVAGCGCDAAPYFRIFNPETQTKKFDPELLYVKKWVPELDHFSYPKPMVDHEAARARCLGAYKKALGRAKSEQ